MELTLMTFNIQHCLNYRTRQIDFDLFAGIIRDSGADIIGLNEVNGSGMGAEYCAQAEILGEKLGFYNYFAKAIDFDGVNPYGNALLSRFPISQPQTIPVPDPRVPQYSGYYETRCLLKAVVQSPRPVTVCVTHFGLNPDEQLLAKNTVLESISDSACVLMGDFNITPENGIHRALSERLRDTAGGNTGALLTFPSDAPQRKIDYIYLSRDWQMHRAEVLPLVASDHRPYIARVSLPDGALL